MVVLPDPPGSLHLFCPNSRRGCHRTGSDPIALKDSSCSTTHPPSPRSLHRLKLELLPRHAPQDLASSRLRGREGKEEEGREKERDRCPNSLHTHMDLLEGMNWSVHTPCTDCALPYFFCFVWFVTYFIRTDCAFVHSCVIIVLIFFFNL